MVAAVLWSNDAEDTLLAIAASVPACQRDGACIEHPEVKWFIEQGGDDRPAKTICAACLVQAECLAFALEQGIGDGV